MAIFAISRSPLMPTMNISLPPELAHFVETELASGAYASASEVIRDGLRHLQHEKSIRDERHHILKREIEAGLAEARAGILSPLSIADIARQVAAEE